MQKRIDFIDTAKGFCILLVVFTHANTYFHLEYELNTSLASFRMPLYFVLSGLFFKTYSAPIFLKKKINNLLVPFFFFYLIFSVAVPNILHAFGYEGLRQSDKLGWASLTNFIFENKFSNSPIWFLLCLFFLNLYFYFIHWTVYRWCKERYRLWTIMAISVMGGVGGYMLGRAHINVWMFMDCALTALPFFCFGYILRAHTTILQPNKFDKYLWIGIVGCFAYVYFVAKPVDFVDNQFGKNTFFPLYTCGIIGTLFILFLSKKLGHLPLISYWGRYSIIILCLHNPVIQVTMLFFNRIPLTEGWLKIGLVLATVMVSFLGIIPLMKRYFAKVTAQQPLLPI